MFMRNLFLNTKGVSCILSSKRRLLDIRKTSLPRPTYHHPFKKDDNSHSRSGPDARASPTLTHLTNTNTYRKHRVLISYV